MADDYSEDRALFTKHQHHTYNEQDHATQQAPASPDNEESAETPPGHTQLRNMQDRLVFEFC